MKEGVVDLDAGVGRAEIGRKAELLARARQAGLPVPPGFIALPGPVEDGAILAALERLGAERYAVRSSALVEDAPGRTAAGLFDSLVGVAAEDVPAAVRAVQASGEGEAVRRYAGGGVPVAVLVQPLVPARSLGVLVLPPEGPVVAEERPPGEPEWGQVTQRLLTLAQAPELVGGARRLAALVHAGGQAGPVQVEYALLPDGGVVFLQARLCLSRPAPQAAGWDPPEGEGVYQRDREHNPDPLSPAQIGLVERADQVGRPLGLRQCVRRGYLYYAHQDQARGGDGQIIAPAALPGCFAEEILPRCDALLAPLENQERGGVALGPALDAYLMVYRLYVGQISPAIRRARGELDRLLGDHLGEPLARHGALLGGLRTLTLRRAQALWELGRQPGPEALQRYLEHYGAFSPCWDVATPCDEEQPARLLELAAAAASGPEPELRRREADAAHQVAAQGLLRRLPSPGREALAALLPVVRAALVVAEDDDGLFFRAQRIVRRALLGKGAALVRSGRLDQVEQVFDVPFECLLAEGPADLRRLAGLGRRDREAQRELIAPDRFVRGRPEWSLPREVLRGHGVHGADPAPVVGRARVVTRLDGLVAPPAADEVLVLPALLPSWCPLLLGARALVTDSGGALSHGATLAREAGVPAVVGTGLATQVLRDGEQVLVDAVGGRVCRVA